MLYDLTHVEFKEENRRTYGKGEKKKKERGETSHKELFNYEEQTKGWWREVGGGWARWVMGIKEGTCCDKHWVSY